METLWKLEYLSVFFPPQGPVWVWTFCQTAILMINCVSIDETGGSDLRSLPNVVSSAVISCLYDFITHCIYPDSDYSCTHWTREALISAIQKCTTMAVIYEAFFSHKWFLWTKKKSVAHLLFVLLTVSQLQIIVMHEYIQVLFSLVQIVLTWNIFVKCPPWVITNDIFFLSTKFVICEWNIG